jgi:hypothetical protein
MEIPHRDMSESDGCENEKILIYHEPDNNKPLRHDECRVEGRERDDAKALRTALIQSIGENQ